MARKSSIPEEILKRKSSISTYDVLIKSGHIRMVLEEDEWTLRNTRTKDLELLKAMGFIPEKSYSVSPV